MFILEREDILGKNEMSISSVLEILEQKHKCSFLGENQGIVTVKADGNGESFSAIVNDDTIGIIKINEMPCKLFIKINGNNGRVVNKDLGLNLQYSIEELENDIQKISVIQNMNNNTFFQSYLYKNEDALIIGHIEKVDKSNLPEGTGEIRDFCITIENKNLINASEDEIQEYAEKWALGINCEDKNLSKEQSEAKILQDEDEFDELDNAEFDELNEDEFDELDDDEFDELDEDEFDELDDDEFDELDEDEFDELDDDEFNELDDDEFDELSNNNKIAESVDSDKYAEEREMKLCKEVYKNIIVKENDEFVDKKSSYEIIDDVYDELLQRDIYINESTIAELENIFERVQELFKLKSEKKQEEDFNR